ncbi:TIGR04282 family arsenosugar biosynthesis glycosyltransferase [Marinobacter litoralis]|uniref:TIGR04282 family arsenosugar biosynthesis glycosyltransferase n=1 Tax=Marinobacter litoralis TaxID=187981 RepID=UPI0018EC9403|nr:TIGR04282 family arsenosugar biosynthesis glycosyltransferase [Marinobacter litoralis]MBJ6138542.1 TIGR04282 family arsenosugar biosynthesis glycosyltransferase [Marinobacter litoralis]
MKPVRILIMAKEPRPGLAKTRLIPALGEENAATLADRLFQRTLQQALAANVGPVELHITPDRDAPYWRELPGAERCTFFSQAEGDLGARMAAAARNGLAQEEAVLIIGTDCPDLDANQLRTMAQSLHSYDCCLCPVTDGGYALLGLRHFSDTLFTDIPWSTADVAQITRDRVNALGWTCYESDYLHDVDEPGDLQRLTENHPELVSPAG